MKLKFTKDFFYDHPDEPGTTTHFRAGQEYTSTKAVADAAGSRAHEVQTAALTGDKK